MPLGPLAWPTFILFTEKIYNKNFPKKISPKFISGSVGGVQNATMAPSTPCLTNFQIIYQKIPKNIWPKILAQTFFRGGGL